MAGSKNVFTRQPVKALYTIYFIATVFVKLPFILTYYIPRSLRPIRGWSYKASVGISALKLWFTYTSRVEFKLPLSLEPGKEKERFVTIKPTQDELYAGVLEDKDIKPEVIGGVWYPKLYPSDVIGRDKKKVVLHFHGGAFVLFGCREKDCGFPARTLSERFDGALVFCPQYRLATSVTGRFPAAIQDAVTAYRYLLDDLKIEPHRIIVSGDSAGATIVLSFLRYIAAANADVNKHPNFAARLPLPAAALLWSPWVNVSDVNHVNRSKNAGVDFIQSNLLAWGAQALTDDSNAVALSNPYVSPFQAPFNIPVPMWVLAGTAEVFYESIVIFVDRMKAERNVIKLYEVQDAPHNIFLASHLLGYQRELEEGMGQVWQMIEEDSW